VTDLANVVTTFSFCLNKFLSSKNRYL